MLYTFKIIWTRCFIPSKKQVNGSSVYSLVTSQEYGVASFGLFILHLAAFAISSPGKFLKSLNKIVYTCLHVIGMRPIC